MIIDFGTSNNLSAWFNRIISSHHSLLQSQSHVLVESFRVGTFDCRRPRGIASTVDWNAAHKSVPIERRVNQAWCNSQSEQHTDGILTCKETKMRKGHYMIDVHHEETPLSIREIFQTEICLYELKGLIKEKIGRTFTCKTPWYQTELVSVTE